MVAAPPEVADAHRRHQNLKEAAAQEHQRDSCRSQQHMSRLMKNEIHQLQRVSGKRPEDARCDEDNRDHQPQPAQQAGL